jgi:hypothetical protein
MAPASVRLRGAGRGSCMPGPYHIVQYSTAELLRAEAAQLRGAEIQFDAPDEAARLRQMQQWAEAQDLSALCLSGGGIRSASFAIGLMQALARKGVLARFDYLSTVSGGGYAGAWLTRWAYNEAHENPAGLGPALERVAGSIARSSPDNDAGGEACPPLQHLRAYSNYLTARIGLGSPDLWTSMVLVIRNVLLNQSVFLPLLLAVAMVPNLYLDVLTWAVLAPEVPRELLAMIPYLVAVLLGFAASMGHTLLPSHEGAGQVSRHTARNWIAVPVCIAAFLLPLWLAGHAPPARPPYGQLWLALFVAGALGGLLGELLSLRPQHAGSPGFSWRCVMASIAAAAFSSGVLTFGAWLWSRIGAIPAALAEEGFELAPGVPGWSRAVLAAAGPCWVLLASLLHASVYVAYERVRVPWRGPLQTVDELRLLNNDADREWLARLGALKLVPALGWGVLALASLIMPAVVRGSAVGEWTWSEIATLVTTLGSAAFTAFGGASPATTGATTPATPTGIPRQVLDLIMPLATGIALLGTFTLLSWFEQWMAGKVLTAFIGKWTVADRLGFDAALIGALAVIGGSTAKWINVNRFSLHAVYRNRLMRAFLGAGHPQRRPDRFTGFDVHDNVRLHRLRGAPDVSRPLYPVVNACLNAAQGDNLAWQERKAASFVLTPIACGSAELERVWTGDERRTAARPQKGAYIDSEVYGGNEVDEAYGDLGISLATAMTISGAAFNPAMGYHTSPVTAFFMTLFNVRLGAWLPNPGRNGRELWQRAGPGLALTPLWQELTGNIGMKGDYLHLSDGGHFENLGIYEMVRRRCRFILVSDASADPRCSLDDLGSAIRKIRIDFNVEIRFRRLELASRADRRANSLPIAIGSIRYPDTDMEGVIVYVKASYADDMTHAFFDRLPVDVREYANRRAEFPHESTADQWFSESQFESYRRLGEYIGMRLSDGRDYDSIASFITDVRRRYPA